MTKTQQFATSADTLRGLDRRQVMRVVNRYIGVDAGYLGDFSYRTHEEFCVEYCDVDVNPYDYEGTTRERFIEILSTRSLSEQAKILRGVVARFPLGNGPSTRTEELRDELLQLAARLEGVVVPGVVPLITTDVVSRAIADAEQLLRTSGATSGVDRVHTALHGYLLAVCDDAGIVYTSDATMPALLKALRRQHRAFATAGPRAQDVARVLNAFGSILDSLNPVRNQASVAHPNPVLLDPEEAMLVINAARTVLSYLDSKLAGSPRSPS